MCRAQRQCQTDAPVCSSCAVTIQQAAMIGIDAHHKLHIGDCVAAPAPSLAAGSASPVTWRCPACWPCDSGPVASRERCPADRLASSQLTWAPGLRQRSHHHTPCRTGSVAEQHAYITAIAWCIMMNVKLMSFCFTKRLTENAMEPSAAFAWAMCTTRSWIQTMS